LRDVGALSAPISFAALYFNILLLLALNMRRLDKRYKVAVSSAEINPIAAPKMPMSGINATSTPMRTARAIIELKVFTLAPLMPSDAIR